MIIFIILFSSIIAIVDVIVVIDIVVVITLVFLCQYYTYIYISLL